MKHSGIERLIDEGAERVIESDDVPWMRPPRHKALVAFKNLAAIEYAPSEGRFPYTQSGLPASAHFTSSERARCAGYDLPSPLQAWRSVPTSGPVRRKFIGCAERLLNSTPANDRMLKAITRLSGACYQAAQFKPAVAKAVIDYFGAKRVLDPCAGWGDRLVGFCASGAVEYVGVDPNARLMPGYRGIAETFGVGRDITMIPQPFEDLVCTREFDLVFTSPPYFDIERYSPDAPEGQSWARYRTWQEWVDGFLAPLMERSLASLAPGGVLALNIKDKVLRKGAVAANLCETAETLARKMGLIGLPTMHIEMKSRPGDQGRRPGEGLAVYEPLFCWRASGQCRPDADLPLWQQSA